MNKADISPVGISLTGLCLIKHNPDASMHRKSKLISSNGYRELIPIGGLDNELRLIV